MRFSPDRSPIQLPDSSPYNFVLEFSIVKMRFFNAYLVCIIVLCEESNFGNLKQVDAFSLKLDEPDIAILKRLSSNLRDSSVDLRDRMITKRSNGFVITDCIVVTSQEGKYYYKSLTGSKSVCGVYFLTDPDKVFEIQFDSLDVPCDAGGRVSIVDGWELDSQYFPSAHEHNRPMSDRYREFCSSGMKKEKRALITSQNAGLVQYKVPNTGGSFSFTVRSLKANTPCNILNEGKTDVYTLRNYGRPSNCSFLALAPSKVKILSMNVGVSGASSPFEVETGTFYSCSERNMKDLVLIGGNEGLDTAKMIPAADICGLDSKPQSNTVVIACNMSTVKLISSGETDNSVTFMVSPVDAEDLLESSLICGL